MPRLPLPPRLRRLTDAPAPAWPQPVDALCEWWARRSPRLRLLAVLLLLVATAAGVQLRVQAAESRWGGQPVTVLVADEDLPVGAVVQDGVRARRLPPRAVPDAAVADVDAEAVLTAPLPRGAVLTDVHVDRRGPAAGLADDLRAVPVAIDGGWGVEAGGWVDVWVDGAPEPAATSRPVLQVREGGHAPTALIGLHAEEVAAVAAAEVRDAVRLTHAPPPTPDR